MQVELKGAATNVQNTHIAGSNDLVQVLILGGEIMSDSFAKDGIISDLTPLLVPSPN